MAKNGIFLKAFSVLFSLLAYFVYCLIVLLTGFYGIEALWFILSNPLVRLFCRTDSKRYALHGTVMLDPLFIKDN